ncbi:MAG: hypothetical protein KC443_22585, partial [Anaerolineales bacterium]|nr:hypothetical protein [Anaerolineales bacterium]
MENGNTQARRIVITGMGMITPLGHNVADTWDAILAGKTGIGPYTLVDPTGHTMPCLFEVKDFDPEAYIDRKEARRRDRFQQLATVAGHEAMNQANLTITDDNRERIGIYMGTGVGGIRTLVEQEHIVIERGARRVSPFSITMIMP